MGTRKPLPLRIAQYLLGMAALLGALGLVLAVFDLHIYSIAGATVGGREFLGRVGIPFAATVGASAVVAFGLLRERYWARPVSVIYWLMPALYAGWDAAVGPGGAMLGIIQGASVLIVGTAVTALYLYRNRAAVAYFAS